MSMFSLVDSRLGPIVGIALVRVLPSGMAYRLADWVATLAASRQRSALVRAVRLNQAMARGLEPSAPELGEAAREVLTNAARGYVTLFKAMADGRSRLLEICHIRESLRREIMTFADRKQGVILVGPHTGSFDVVLLAFGIHGFPVQALSHRAPRGSYLTQNAIRRRYGLDLSPISLSSLRQAVKHLRQGGAVLTGIDLPDPRGEELLFLGRETRLPIGHARLAVKTGCPIIVALCRPVGDKEYEAILAATLFPEDGGSEHQRALSLAQQVISVVDDHVRKMPGEWLMFHDLWPAASGEASSG